MTELVGRQECLASRLEALLDKEICCWCQESIPKELRSIEHLVELSNGGLHSATNLDMSCLKCNSSRPNRNNDNLPNKELTNDQSN